MSEIIVEELSSSSGGAIFQVTLRDESGETKHKVRMSHDYHQKLANGKSREEFVRKSFEFLLAMSAIPRRNSEDRSAFLIGHNQCFFSGLNLGFFLFPRFGEFPKPGIFF